jgi:4-amino-4-deoxy-L-arabinose transferase-like glycosyltransferase
MTSRTWRLGLAPIAAAAAAGFSMAPGSKVGILLLIAAAAAAALILPDRFARAFSTPGEARVVPDAPVATSPRVPEERFDPRPAAGFRIDLPGTRRQELVALAAILLLAAFLRCHRLAEVPAGLFCDEASIGYNAYSLAKTGRDASGQPMPLFVRSFVAFLNPVYVYAAAGFEGLLGLSVGSLRVTSAFFGVIAVLGLYLLATALYGSAVGLLAALLLAICPWHLHFSRIAFELISLPACALLGFAFLFRGLDSGGWRSLVTSAVFLALTPYCYAVAQVFVPLMLLASLALFPRELWRRRRSAAAGLLVLGAMLVPLVHFYWTTPRSLERFRQLVILEPGRPWSSAWSDFAANYGQYLSFRFLFLEGDPLIRHSVPGFGENLASLAPWAGIGVIAAPLAFGRRGLFVLSWVLAYPVAAALVRETPAATRSIVGAPLVPLLAAIGLASVLTALGRLPRSTGTIAARAALLVLAACSIGFDSLRYLRAYFVDYPKRSAATISGFQYGYEEAIRFMESRRQDYSRLALTATDVNQPQLFPPFYRRQDPADYQKRGDIGYSIFVPQEYSAYDPAQERILYAAAPQDLTVFEDYDVLEDVRAPDGRLVFRIIEPRRRKAFLDRWVVAGPLPAGLVEVPVELRVPSRDPIWTRVSSPFTFIDLNRGRFGENAEDVCAVAAIDVFLEGPAVPASLECVGSEDRFRATLRGRTVLDAAALDRGTPSRGALALQPGSNIVSVLTCETVGDWYFGCSVVGSDGTSLRTAQPQDPRGSGAR